jgi:hypothetical protein
MLMWDREPAVIVGLVQAILVLAVSFGLDLSAEQVGSLVTFTSVALAFALRRNVSPIASAPVQPVAVVGDAATAPGPGAATDVA